MLRFLPDMSLIGSSSLLRGTFLDDVVSYAWFGALSSGGLYIISPSRSMFNGLYDEGVGFGGSIAWRARRRDALFVDCGYVIVFPSVLSMSSGVSCILGVTLIPPRTESM